MTAARVALVERAPAGWWVAARNKRPLMRWRDAAPDHGEVIARLREGADLAVVPASLGLLVVDSDIRDVGIEADPVFARADSILGEPAGWTPTPRAGRHLWYRCGRRGPTVGLKLDGRHAGEVRCHGALVTVHDPETLARVLDHLANCKDVADRVPTFLARFARAPVPEPRPAPRERSDYAPIGLDDWRAALDLKRAGREWTAPCPLCGGTDRFRVLPDGRAFCRQCMPTMGDPARFRALVETVFGEARHG